MKTTFVANDPDGAAHTIQVVTRNNAVPVLGGAAFVDDIRFATEAGEEVVKDGPGAYRVVPTGVALTTDDPDAP